MLCPHPQHPLTLSVISPQVLTAVIKKAQLPGGVIDSRDSFANVKASAAFRCVCLLGDWVRDCGCWREMGDERARR